MAQKKKGKQAAPPLWESGAQQRRPAGERQRAPGGVPPAEAFNSLPRRKPPNLPGYEQDHTAARAAAGQRPQSAGTGPANGRAAGAGKDGGSKKPPAQQAGGKQAPPGEEKPRPPANPAKRRRNRRIAAVVTVVLLIAVGCFFTVTTLFKIEHFELEGEGEGPYSLEEVTAAFGHAVGDNMYGFSAGNAAARIQSALPYIEAVTVRRRLPSTILFRVEPAVETYSVAQPKGGYAVLSATRKMLRQADDPPAGLLEIRGLSGVVLEPGLPMALEEDPAKALSAAAASVSAAGSQSQAGSTPQSQPEDSETPPDPEKAETADNATAAASYNALDLLLAAVESTGLEEVNWVDVADPLVLKLGWQGRITVLLGPRSGLEEKLATAAVLLTDTEKNLVDSTSRGTLDMTYYASTGRSYFRPE